MKRQSNHEKQPRYTKEKKFVAVLAAAGALGAAALSGCSTTGYKIYAADESGRVTATYDVDDVLDGKIAPITSAEKPNGSELTKSQRFAADPSTYETFDEDLRVADQAEYFYKGYDVTYNHIINNPTDPLSAEEQAVFYKPDLNKPRSEWTDQDYLNFDTIATFFATGQDDPNEALRSSTVVARPGTKTFDNMKEWITKYPGNGLTSIYRARTTTVSNSELKPTTFNGIVIDDGGRIIEHESLISHDINVSVFVNNDDGAGHVLSINQYVYSSMNNPSLQALIRHNS